MQQDVSLLQTVATVNGTRQTPDSHRQLKLIATCNRCYRNNNSNCSCHQQQVSVLDSTEQRYTTKKRRYLNGVAQINTYVGQLKNAARNVFLFSNIRKRHGAPAGPAHNNSDTEDRQKFATPTGHDPGDSRPRGARAEFTA